jgi:hypothetical protein
MYHNAEWCVAWEYFSFINGIDNIVKKNMKPIRLQNISNPVYGRWAIDKEKYMGKYKGINSTTHLALTKFRGYKFDSINRERIIICNKCKVEKHKTRVFSCFKTNRQLGGFICKKNILHYVIIMKRV